MNQDIIDYLEGYWELSNNGEYYLNKTMFYVIKENLLLIGGDINKDCHEVEIKDLTHLIQLEELL